MNELSKYLFDGIYPVLSKKLTLLFEGGNVFDDTDSIKKEYIPNTLKSFNKEVNKYFPNILNGYKTLGSVGKKDLSGDIDLAISSKNIFNDDGSPKLKELGIDENQYNAVFAKYKSKARSATDEMLSRRAVLFFIAKNINDKSSELIVDDKGSSTGSLFCKFPQYDEKGNKTTQFVQIDLNFGNVDWLTFAYYSDVYKDNVKGLHRTQLMLSLFGEAGYTFGHNYGVKNKETGEMVANNPVEAIELLNKLYGFSIDADTLSNYFKLHEFLKKNIDKNKYNNIIDRYLKILDSTRTDIPLDLQDYWIKNKERLDLKGKFLPDDSNLITYRRLTESGAAGASRIPRSAVDPTFKSYIQKVLKNFPAFKGAKISGSYNTTIKHDHGDIDLIIHIDRTDISIKKLKEMFRDHINSLSDDVSVPFSSGKYAGRKSMIAGEIVIVNFPIEGFPDKTVQIDNIITTSETESNYRKTFLDLPAEKQGLLIGLAKAILLEEDPSDVFDRLHISNLPELKDNQEYEFNLSTQGLSLRIVTLDSNLKQLDRKEVWSSHNWNDVNTLFTNFNVTGSFEDMLEDFKSKLKNPRSLNRIKGLFKSMVHVTSGEEGTPKGENKLKAIQMVNSL
jgi:hypothetical protein